MHELFVFIIIWSGKMVTSRFDTFEDEKEMVKMIRSLQSKTREYMTSPDAWEFRSIEELQPKNK